MDRIPSVSILPNTPGDTKPQLLQLPEEILANILSRIPTADNATLSSLVMSCKHLWTMLRADALLSFFYAARAAYDCADTEKKVTIFKILSEWLPQVADQLPDELRMQMLEQLVSFAPLLSDSLADNVGMVNALNRLVAIARQENDRRIEACREDPAALGQVRADLLRNDIVSFKGLNVLSHYYEQIVSLCTRRNDDSMRIIQKFD